ncbi:conserved Plasmodium protein, unknown function [Plasmodium malariae]|uniref:Uncharacterized protein n=2 Tax=Plasmodium malariae TaxID=5858 RepID=A0A1C3L0K4_PLAMA|nr:conserved Plasmodium protein, unknown function [Plasmodium malariae]
MKSFNSSLISDKNKADEVNSLNSNFGIQQHTLCSNKNENEKNFSLNSSINITNNTANVYNDKNNVMINENINFKNNFANLLNNNGTNTYQDKLNGVSKSGVDNSNKTDNNTNDEFKKNNEKNDLQINNQNGNISLENKFNFNSSLKIRKSLTEQLCGKKNDDMGESKNRVLNSLLLSSFCNLIWNNNIYKHEYLISKEILSKYFKAIEKNPDKNNCCIVPIYNLDKIKMVLNDQDKNIKILKKKKLCIKKNNENLLFILNIIKNNFSEIKIKAQRIIQRLLFRLDILDKLFILKNNTVFFSNKYEFNKFKLMEILDFFNSFNIDNQLQKINKNITELVKEKKNFQNFLYTENEFTSSLKSTIAKNEQDITELKSTTSEISINLEENKEYLYHLNAFEREENYEML